MKQFLKKLAPGLFSKLKSIKKRRQFRLGHGGSEYRAKVALVRAHGLKILTGPFAGMDYGDDVACSAYVAKLVGSYEEELHDAIAAIVADQPTTVIDVGCAEGYYAVGFARLLPNATIYAYDTDIEAQQFCRELAKRNNVADRVRINGFCDHAELRKLTTSPAFILSDCEGFELELLNPQHVTGLSLCTMLIELHDFLSPGLTATLTHRFENTHRITLINTQDRDPNKYEVLKPVLEADRRFAVREGRPAAMQWAYLEPK